MAFNCPKCGRNCGNQPNLNSHIEKHRRQKERKLEQDRYKCQECGVLCGSKSNLDGHLQKKHIQGTRDPSNAEQHSFKCTHCDKVCGNAHNLKRHLPKHEKEGDDGASKKPRESRDRKYKCSTCNRVYSKKGHFLKHVASHNNGRTTADGNSQGSGALNAAENDPGYARSQSLTCDCCNVHFKTKKSLIRHRQEQKRRCKVCKQVYPTVKSLKKHEKQCSLKPGNEKEPLPSTSFASGEPSEPKVCQIMCRTCKQMFPGWRKLYSHRKEAHNPPLTLQNDPYDSIDPNVLPEEWKEDEKLRQMYEDRKSVILAPHREDAVVREYNFPLHPGIDSVETIVNGLREIYGRQDHAFKVNFSVSMILRHVETGEYRFFYGSHNSLYFSRPRTISNAESLAAVIQDIRDSFDDVLWASGEMDDTKWRLALLTNIVFSVFRTGFPLGRQGVELPLHVKNCPAVIGLVKDHRGRAYTDNKCIFRCLALHRGKEVTDLEPTVQEYFRKWRDHRHDEEEFNFEGLAMTELDDFESVFQVNVNVFYLHEDGRSQTVRASTSRHMTDGKLDTLNVNSFKDHLSYISNVEFFSKRFQCPACDKFFLTHVQWSRHQRACKNETKLLYPGGFYSPNRSIFQKLEEFGILVDEELRNYPWFVTFDFECSLVKVCDAREGEKLAWTHKHQPVSVSIASNVEGFTEAKCIVDPNPETLVESFVHSLAEIQEEVTGLATERWGHVLADLESHINMWLPMSNDLETHNDDDDDESSLIGEGADMEPVLQDNDTAGLMERQNSDRVAAMTLKRLKSLYREFETYCSQLVVLGFNSAGYDLNTIKRHIAKNLNMTDQSKGCFTVKRNNRYCCLSNEKFRFLDISHFLAPGTSYKDFLASFHCEQAKGFFPYDWFTDVRKLDHDCLPPIEAFFSEIRQVNTLEEDYLKYCSCLNEGKSHAQALKATGLRETPSTREENYTFLKSVWESESMQTFRDFLVWYNNLDVLPFVEAVDKMRLFYLTMKVDIFKDAISLPGVSRKLLFECGAEAGACFSRFGYKDRDLYDCIKKNIIGGPRIIFTRRMESGRTFIRGNPNKVCQGVVGYDSNALYLWALGQPLCHGPYVRRRAEFDFKPEVSDRYQIAFDWLDLVAGREGKTILHRRNNGHEVRIDGFLVDGFCPDTKEIFEFNGCYWHGHFIGKANCPLTAHISDEVTKLKLRERFQQTQEKKEYLLSHGFTVRDIWECDFRNMVRHDQDVDSFVAARRPNFYGLCKSQTTATRILEAVEREELFGMLEVDIEVPDSWPEDMVQKPRLPPHDYFGEMSPIFCNTVITFEDMSQNVKDYIRRHKLSEAPRKLLVGGMRAEQILLATPLLKWYLKHGIVVTRVYQVVEFQPLRCFEDFTEKVSEARRQGKQNTEFDTMAKTMKLIGNSGYGSLIMDKEKFTKTVYCHGDEKCVNYVNNPRFVSACELNDDEFYEVDLKKQTIALDLPIQLGYFVLQYGKLRMLQFYYDFLDKYVDCCDFEMAQMDTDSLYFAITGKTLDSVIRPDRLCSYFEQLIGHCDKLDIRAEDGFWFPRQCCQVHADRDLFTPALFKLEKSGQDIVGLCSKTYAVNGENDGQCKFSCKGLNKRRVRDPYGTMVRVLETGIPEGATNIGFRARHNQVFTYTEMRLGFSYLYCKRKLCEDGVHTTPLNITLSPWKEISDFK